MAPFSCYFVGISDRVLTCVANTDWYRLQVLSMEISGFSMIKTILCTDA